MWAARSLEGSMQASEVELVVRTEHPPLSQSVQELCLVLIAQGVGFRHGEDVMAPLAHGPGEIVLHALIEVQEQP
jgi:hypothetical protein